ncbi:MAG: hypothetical protein ACKPEY_12875 [Planctomycetota bacterium]
MAKTISPTLRIERVAVKDLESLAHRDSQGSPDQGVVPINLRRARAHANNPHASPDDVSLIMAYLGDACVGYLGLMPGVLRRGETFHKVLFGTTLYVQPEFRRYGVVFSLMGELKRLGTDVVIAGQSDDAASVYRHLRLKEFAKLTVYELKIRKGEVASIPLRVARRLLKRVGLPSGWLDSGIAGIEAMYFRVQKKRLYTRMARRSQVGMEKIAWVEVSHVLPDEFDGLERSQAEPYFYRSAQVINWMIADRWTECKADGKQTSGGYYFASYCDDFRHLAVRLTAKPGNDCLGYVLLSIRKTASSSTLKLLDVRLGERLSMPAVVAVVIHYAKIYDVDRLEFGNEWLEVMSTAFSQSASTIRRERNYFYFDAAGEGLLTEVADQLALSYCDGDRAFT